MVRQISISGLFLWKDCDLVQKNNKKTKPKQTQSTLLAAVYKQMFTRQKLTRQTFVASMKEETKVYFLKHF